MNKTIEPRKKSNWGKGIFALYSLFVLFIVVLVFTVAFEKFDLVESDYYYKDLAYQKSIEKMKRSEQLPEPLTWSYNRKMKFIKIQFPKFMNTSDIGGMVTFYRPSNARYDQQIPIEVDSLNSFVIATDRFIPGNWTMKIDWFADTLSFLTNESVVIEK